MSTEQSTNALDLDGGSSDDDKALIDEARNYVHPDSAHALYLIGALADALESAFAGVERLTEERDSARSKAALLFEQNAEALRIARESRDARVSQVVVALQNVQRILGAFPDDETAEQ